MKKNRFKISTYKDGGSKDEWISQKIKILENEDTGRSHAENVAIAFSMYEQEHNKMQAGGKVDSHYKNIDYIQQGVDNERLGRGVYMYTSDGKREFVTEDEFLNTVQRSAPYKKYISSAGNVGRRVPGTENKNYTPVGMDSTPEQQVNSSLKPIFSIQQGVDNSNLGAGMYFHYKDPSMEGYNYETDRDFISKEAWETGVQKAQNVQDFKRRQTADKVTPQLKYSNNTVAQYQNGATVSLTPEQLANTNPLVEDMSIYNNPNMQFNKAYNTMTGNYDENGNALNVPSTQAPIQFANPYGGVDIETGASFLGQSIENEDPLGIVAGGLKTLTGTARNIFGGIGQARARNEGLKNYMDNQRDSMIGQSQTFQDGGEAEQEVPQEQVMQFIAESLQGGATPEQIAQQLAQAGVPQEQIMTLIQTVMQQMQAPAPQQENPVMRDGGEILNTLKGKKIVDYKLNTQTGNYDVIYE